MRLAIPTVLITVSALSVFGCSSNDDDGSRTPFSSGLGAGSNSSSGDAGSAGANTGSGRPVADLDDDDLAKLCDNFDAHLEANVGLDVIAQALCLPQAILLGGSPTGCRQRLEQCKSDLPRPVRIDVGVTGTQQCISDLRQCNANIVDLEGCINVRLDGLYELIDTLSCATADKPETRDRAQATTGASACVNTNAGCDRFIGIDAPVLQ